MKTLVILLFVGIVCVSCNFGLLEYQRSSASNIQSVDPGPNCFQNEQKDYRFKTDLELESMTPSELIDEVVGADYFDLPGSGEYWTKTHYYLRKSGADLFPTLTNNLNSYDVGNTSTCSTLRFQVTAATADYLDNFCIRLKGSNDGLLAIGALERSIERMRAAGFVEGGSKGNRNLDFAILFLKGLKGKNVTDQKISDTLKARHGVSMSDDELAKFSNYLVSTDAGYPSWSEPGEYQIPMLMKESKKYHDAYLKFKKNAK